MPPMERGKVFAKHKSIKGILPEVCKEFIRLNSKKPNNPIKTWAEDVNRHFSKEDIQTADRHMKKGSTSLSTREMQITPTRRYHLTPVRMAKINTTRRNRYWQGCGERGPLVHCWWDCKLVQPLWTTVWRVLKKKKKKKKNWNITCPGNSTSGHLATGKETIILKRQRPTLPRSLQPCSR